MKVIVKTFLHAEKTHDGFNYLFFGCDMSKYGYAVIDEREIEVEVPDDFDPAPSLIAGLKKQQQEIRANATQKLNRLEEQIQSLLAIENKEAQ